MPAPLVRTPRKRKIWAGRHTILDVGGAGPELDDLLSPTYSDLGLSSMAGVTVMRVRGFMQLVNWTTTASTPAWDTIRIGMGWLDDRAATASGGSGLVARPAQDGSRETRWYQQFVLGGIESSAAVVGLPLNGDASDKWGRVDFDITNMQKAPTAESKFMLTWFKTTAWETDTVRLQLEIDTMLALP